MRQPGHDGLTLMLERGHAAGCRLPTLTACIDCLHEFCDIHFCIGFWSGSGFVATIIHQSCRFCPGVLLGVSFTAVSGLVSHRKAPGSNLASWQIVWLIQAAIAVRQDNVLLVG
jgi:hypothetical protein